MSKVRNLVGRGVRLIEPTGVESVFYLVRGQNVCGTGTYGVGSNGNERIANEACP